MRCTYWEEDWLGLCACCSSSLSAANKASREQCLSCKRREETISHCYYLKGAHSLPLPAKGSGWVLPVDAWWRIVSAWEKVHNPPIDIGLHTHPFRHVALLRGKTPEMVFQTTYRGNKNNSANEWPRQSQMSVCPPVSDTYRLQDCQRHLKFCPAFLLCSAGAEEVCCAGSWGLWLPASAGWDRGGGDGVTVGCGRVNIQQYWF